MERDSETIRGPGKFPGRRILEDTAHPTVREVKTAGALPKHLEHDRPAVRRHRGSPHQTAFTGVGNTGTSPVIVSRSNSRSSWLQKPGGRFRGTMTAQFVPDRMVGQAGSLSRSAEERFTPPTGGTSFCSRGCPRRIIRCARRRASYVLRFGVASRAAWLTEAACGRDRRSMETWVEALSEIIHRTPCRHNHGLSITPNTSFSAAMIAADCFCTADDIGSVAQALIQRARCRVSVRDAKDALLEL